MPSSPKIRSVVAIPVAVPLTVPTRIATREVLAREFVLVEVTTDDGVVGVGYTYTGTTGGEAVRQASSTTTLRRASSASRRWRPSGSGRRCSRSTC